MKIIIADKLGSSEKIKFDENDIKEEKLLLLARNNDDSYSFYIIRDISEENLNDILDIKNVETCICNEKYTWMGIQYNEHRILVNLISLTVQYFNSKDNKKWEYSDDVEEIDNYLFIKVGDAMLRINVCDIKCDILYNGHLSFVPYHNFLLGHNGQFVFNENAELQLSE